MKNNFKFLVVLAILLVGCICIGSTFATDLSVDDVRDLNSVDNTKNIEIAHDDSSQKDVEITNLQEGEGNITELEELINSASSGSIINLTKDYNLSRSGIGAININKPLTIDGQGHTINSNLTYIFIINSDNVTIKNITFIGSKNDTCLGAIYWESGSNGSINSCSFINFNKIYAGGVIYWNGAYGSVSACNFINSSSSTNGGGAIYWTGANGSVSACNFINSSSDSNGGAISWFGANGKVSNCNFTNSNAGLGGAIYWTGANGSVSACSFNNSNAGEGGAIFWAADNGSVSACSFNNSNSSSGAAIFWDFGYSDGIINRCNFTNSEAVGLGGAISLYFVNNCTVMNCNFINSTADENNGGAIFCSGSNCNIIACNFSNSKAGLDGGAIFWHEYAVNGSVSNCIFNNSNAANDGGAIYWNATDGSLSACNFFNSSAHGKYEGYGYGLGGAIFWGKYTPNSINDCNFTSSSARYGGSIYWANVDNGTVSDCNFFNSNAANDGGAIYWSGVNGTVSDCTFTKCNADSRDGGAIYWSAINGNINACDFTNCTTQSNKGGSIYITEDSQNTIVSSSNFTNSRACTDGGAISWLANNGVVINCNFINSSVGLSGGAIYWSGVNGTVSDSSFVNCSSVNDGGSIMISADLISAASHFLIKYCNFTNSTTGNNGGTIIWGGSGNMIACNFINSSAKDGGTIHCTGVLGSINIADCNFTNSSARNNGGVIYWENDGIISGCNFLNFDVKNKGSAIYVPTEYCYLDVVNSTCTPINDTKAPIYNNGNIRSDLNITTLNGTDKNVAYGDKVNITATVTTSGIPIAGGTITLKVNNADVNATSNYDGIYSAFYTVDFVGTKPVNATYLNTRMQKVKPVQIVNAYNLVSNAKGNFNISVENIPYGKGFTIVVTNATGVDNEKLNGTVKFTVNNNDYNFTISNGEGSEYFSDVLPVGNYFINASLIVPNYDVMYNNATFDVVNCSFNLIIENITYGESFAINVTNATGIHNELLNSTVKVIFVLKNYTEYSKEYVLNVNNGTVYKVIDDTLPAGEYRVCAFLELNDEAKDVSSVETSFTINKTNVTMSLNVTGILVKVAVNGVEGKALPSGNVTVFVDDVEIANVTLNNGKCNYILDLDVGVHNITVSYNGDNNYTGITNSVNVTIIPQEIDINATINNLTYGDGFISGKVNASMSGTVVLFVSSGSPKYVDVNESGEFIVPIDLDAGDYPNVNVLFISADGKYIGSSNVSFNVAKTNSTVNIDINDISYGDDAIVNVTVSGVEGKAVPTGNVTLFINGKEYANKTLDDGKCQFIISDLDCGNYNITAYYEGNCNYNNSNSSVELIVTSKEIVILTFVDDVVYGSNLTGILNASGKTGVISVTINGTVYNGTVDLDGKFTLYNTDSLNAGSYKYLPVTFISDDGRYIGYDDCAFVIIPKTINITATVDNISFGDNFSGSVSADLPGWISIYPGDGEFSYEFDTIGKFSTEWEKALSPGTYEAVILFFSDDGNYKSTTSVNYTITKGTINISIDPVSGKAGDKATIIVRVNNQNNKPVQEGTIILSLNGKKYSAKVINGIATIKLTLPKAGNYSVKVIYGANDDYLSSNMTFTINVTNKTNPIPNPNPKPKHKILSNGGSMENTGNPILVLLIALALIGLESFRRKL